MEKEQYSIAIHSQSDRPDAPLKFEGDLSEQAFDSRVLCLLGVGVAVTSLEVESGYHEYYKGLLKLKLPVLLVPKLQQSLSKGVMEDEDVVDELLKFQAKRSGQAVLSVFDPTENEVELYNYLVQKGLNIQPEVNIKVAKLLGNKAGFRRFCQEHDLPQISGGVFDTLSDLEQFITQQQDIGNSVIVKHPTGTAGEGLAVIHSDQRFSSNDSYQLPSWVTDGGPIVAEVYHAKGSEHALHIYVDPITGESHVTGIYDQLVKENEGGGYSHYGCKYPTNTQVKTELDSLAQNELIPALKEVSYTGPACFDVLLNKTHLMELNARAGANMYVHQMVKRVARVMYPSVNPNDVSFMFLSGINHDIHSFTEFRERFDSVTLPSEEGMLLFTTPNRHRFGSYDITAMSPHSVEEAEGLLFSSLEKILGLSAAREMFDQIHIR